jgi:4-hydroxybenzoate polyprenyltransferase
MDLAKLRRLWQPRRLLFWQMLAFNGLSSVCAWALNTLPLNAVGLLLIGTVGLMNVGFGLLAAWALLREAPPPR